MQLLLRTCERAFFRHTCSHRLPIFCVVGNNWRMIHYGNWLQTNLLCTSESGWRILHFLQVCLVPPIDGHDRPPSPSPAPRFLTQSYWALFRNRQFSGSKWRASAFLDLIWLFCSSTEVTCSCLTLQITPSNAVRGDFHRCYGYLQSAL